MGVVTLIYFISGGLTFVGYEKDVRKNVWEYDVMKRYHLADGWKHPADKGIGTVVVEQDNPVEWIVAFEYRDLAIDKKDAAFEQREVILVDPPASKPSWPWFLEA